MSWELDESKKVFADAGLKLSTLTNFSNIIGLALERGQITEGEWAKILEFKKDPRAWGAKIIKHYGETKIPFYRQTN